MSSQITNSEILYKEIVGFLTPYQEKRLKSQDAEKIVKLADDKIINLIKNTPIGEFKIESARTLDNIFFKQSNFARKSKIKFWDIYQECNNYIQANNEKKPSLFQRLEETFSKEKNRIIINPSILNKFFVVGLYESKNPQLIQLFEKIFPIPPLSLFDPHNQPPALVERQTKKDEALATFKARYRAPLDAYNDMDWLKKEKVFTTCLQNVTEKIVYLQRHIRSNNRAQSELKRVGERNFKGQTPEIKEQKARQMIEDANTPYTPKGCSPQLAERIKNAAAQIKLFDSVFHLLDPTYVQAILDNLLCGRENLINWHRLFRFAALTLGDIERGDSNAICLGPKKIDPKCLRNRTIRLQLDAEMLTCREGYKKNANIFFKQQDLGYDIETKQSIKIGDTTLSFNHTGALTNGRPKCASLQLYGKRSIEYASEIPTDLLISSNVEQMHQILTLNFFRFLDQLTTPSYVPASTIIEKVYEEIEKLDDKQLQEFLLDLGKKMSCSAEFNMSGAYKIDMNALRCITIFNEEDEVDSISIEDLCAQLNEGKFELLDKLHNLVPEIFYSGRFMNLLFTKVQNSTALDRLQTLFVA